MAGAIPAAYVHIRRRFYHSAVCSLGQQEGVCGCRNTERRDWTFHAKVRGGRWPRRPRRAPLSSLPSRPRGWRRVAPRLRLSS